MTNELQKRRRPRQTGARALPDNVAQGVIDDFYTNGELLENIERKLHAQGYLVTRTTIRSLIHGRTYPHLKRPEVV